MVFAPRPPEKRSPGAIAISVVMHLVVGAVLLRAVVGSHGIAEWLVGKQLTKAEQIAVVVLAPPRGDPSGGGSAENGVVKPTVSRANRPLVAPSVVPAAVPDASGGGRGGAGGGTGSGYGTGRGSGVARGVVPGYDPRLYPGSPEPARVVRTPKERLDSVIVERFAEYADSVAQAPRSNVTEDGRGDLTFTRGGKTYGWSQRGIVLGNITLPAPLLALLPLNRVGSNPSAILRQENPWQMRNQIQAGAQVAINAETFNERVKRIRERRDRERKEAREGQPQPVVTPTPAPVP
jgi:hypothetical protein